MEFRAYDSLLVISSKNHEYMSTAKFKALLLEFFHMSDTLFRHVSLPRRASLLSCAWFKCCLHEKGWLVFFERILWEYLKVNMCDSDLLKKKPALSFLCMLTWNPILSTKQRLIHIHTPECQSEVVTVFFVFIFGGPKAKFI